MADFVPETHPVRQWADTFPWAALVAAVERNFAQRFPTPTARGRAPVATRVLLALELLKHELHCSDEQICSQLRTDLAVMYACGIAEVQVNRAQAHFGATGGTLRFDATAIAIDHHLCLEPCTFGHLRAGKFPRMGRIGNF